MKRSIFKKGMAWLCIAAMGNHLALTAAVAQTIPAASTEPVLTEALSTTSAGANLFHALPAGQTPLTTAQKIALLRTKVKYVFVLFQENRSFDHYFGTYPGANGLVATYPGASTTDPYAEPATSFGSYTQSIAYPDGSFRTVSPFLAPRTIVNANGQTVQLFPESHYSVDHSHSGYLNDFHVDANWNPRNDGYALDQEGLAYAGTPASPVLPTLSAYPTLQQTQKGLAALAHIDCDTIPFLWNFADVGVLFDNMHQTATGPSSPNAIAMIAGQVGDTQWVKHPSEANTSGPYLPMLTDGHPYPGSSQDTSAIKPPYGPDDGSFTTASGASATAGTAAACCTGSATSPFPLTFASLPLSFMGHNIQAIVANDQNPAVDLADVQQDIAKIAAKDPVVGWGWYQQGYGPEPFDGVPAKTDEGNFNGPNGQVEHASYIVHHNGPQYFGYVGDNPVAAANLHALGQFYTDLSNHNLPAAGGVFYVRGGYFNNDGLSPADTANPTVVQDFVGNDDHGSYSDSQIAEALVADSVNAIANATDANGNSIWSQSAIIITYDESDGFYDHQPEQFRSFGPDGQPETGGPRIPLIVLSPYAASHTVSHQYSEHSSVIKFIDELFNLTPLASLPSELAATNAGATLGGLFNYPAGFNGGTGSTGQAYLGPADNNANMGDLTEAFDNDRLLGNIPPLAAPTIPQTVVTTLPHFGVTLNSISTVASATAYGCQNLGITPTDYPGGAYATGTEVDPPPADYNPRPTVSTGAPYYNTGSNTATCSSSSTAAQLAICTQGNPATAWPN
jgi:phospholipase C